MRGVLTALACLSTLTAVAAPVRPLQLELTRDPSASACPDEAAIRSAVAARLGYDPFDPSAKASLKVAIARQGSGYRAELALTDETGSPKTRQLKGAQADCADLASALPF